MPVADARTGRPRRAPAPKGSRRRPLNELPSIALVALSVVLVALGSALGRRGSSPARNKQYAGACRTGRR